MNFGDHGSLNRIAKHFGARSIVLAAICTSALGAESEAPSSDSTQRLQEIIVESRRFLSDTAMSATKVAIPIAEVPQSISVLDEALIRDLGFRSYVEALSVIPGAQLSGNFVSFGAQVMSRGYPVSQSGYKVNGMPFDNVLLDNIAVERIEFVRGGSGTTYGEGGPGGFLNLILRRPTNEPTFLVGAETDNFDLLRGHATLSGPLNAAGIWRGVIAASAERTDTFVDITRVKSRAGYAGLEFMPTTDTSVGLFSYHAWSDQAPYHNGWPAQILRNGAGDLVSIRFPEELPVDTFTGAAWTYEEDYSALYQAELQHRFTPALTLALLGSYYQNEFEHLMSDLCCELSSSGETTVYNLFEMVDQVRSALELRATGALEVMGQPSQYVVTLEKRTQKTDFPFSEYLAAGPYNVLGPVPNVPYVFPSAPGPSLFIGASHTSYDIASASATALSDLTDRLTVTLGVRYDDFTPKRKRFDGDFAQLTVEEEFPTDNLGFRASLMYEFFPRTRLYYSYGDTFVINLGTTCSGEVLPPETGEIHELGVKRELSEQLLLSAAAYRIRSTGNQTRLPASTCPQFTTNPVAPGVGQRSSGGDIELSGRISPAWNITLGYAYTDASAPLSGAGGLELPTPGVSRHQGSVFTLYDVLQGALQGLGVGGGFTYRSKFDATSGAPGERLVFDDQLRTSLAIYYRWSDAGSLRLNIQNLLDEKHPQSAVRTPDFQNLWMEPRRISLSVDLAF